MFSLPLRLAHGANAIHLKRNSGPRAARRGAIGAAEVFWLTLIAALVAWLVSLSPNHRLTGSSPGCLFVGKAGVICDSSTTAAHEMARESADTCLSLGRGGRYCPPAK